MKSATDRGERRPWGCTAWISTGTSGSRVRTCRPSPEAAWAVKESMMAGPKPYSAMTMAM